MSTFGTPRELALVAFLVGIVIVHSIVPKIGEFLGGLFEQKPTKRGGEQGSGFREHPHNYWREMPAAARYLIDGT